MCPSSDSYQITCNRQPFMTEDGCYSGYVDIHQFDDFPFCESVDPTSAAVPPEIMDAPINIPLPSYGCACFDVKFDFNAGYKSGRDFSAGATFRAVSDCCDGNYVSNINLQIPCPVKASSDSDSTGHGSASPNLKRKKIRMSIGWSGLKGLDNLGGVGNVGGMDNLGGIGGIGWDGLGQSASASFLEIDSANCTIRALEPTINLRIPCPLKSLKVKIEKDSSGAQGGYLTYESSYGSGSSCAKTMKFRIKFPISGTATVDKLTFYGNPSDSSGDSVHTLVWDGTEHGHVHLDGLVTKGTEQTITADKIVQNAGLTVQRRNSIKEKAFYTGIRGCSVIIRRDDSGSGFEQPEITLDYNGKRAELSIDESGDFWLFNPDGDTVITAGTRKKVFLDNGGSSAPGAVELFSMPQDSSGSATKHVAAMGWTNKFFLRKTDLESGPNIRITDVGGKKVISATIDAGSACPVEGQDKGWRKIGASVKWGNGAGADSSSFIYVDPDNCTIRPKNASLNLQIPCPLNNLSLVPNHGSGENGDFTITSTDNGSCGKTYTFKVTFPRAQTPSGQSTVSVVSEITGASFDSTGRLNIHFKKRSLVVLSSLAGSSSGFVQFPLWQQNVDASDAYDSTTKTFSKIVVPSVRTAAPIGPVTVFQAVSHDSIYGGN